MASIVKFHSWQENVLNGTAPIDWDTDTIKVALITSATAPVAATHVLWTDLSANEVSGTNYTTGGATIGSITVVESAGTTTVDGADVSWSQNAGGFTNARYALIYKVTAGSPDLSPLVGYIDFVSDKGNVNGDLTIQWNASGIFDQT